MDLFGKVMSLLFNMLSRWVVTFLPRSNRLLISWLQSPSAVILEPPPKKNLALFPWFPHLFPMKWWDWMPWSSFSECWALSQPVSNFPSRNSFPLIAWLWLIIRVHKWSVWTVFFSVIALGGGQRFAELFILPPDQKSYPSDGDF